MAMFLEAKCRTTAMGIMPHADVDTALSLALSLDIPFWPQLPRVSYYEDMYAQLSGNFPGIAVDVENQRLDFNTARFQEELGGYFEKRENPETFALTEEYSAVYHRFLSLDLGGCHAVRGQVTGPVSFGFNVIDEGRKPIIYNEEVRAILFDFVQKKVNVQYQELAKRNPNAFVWVDEPGLGHVFSGLSGYNDQQAKEDYASFLEGLEGPKGLHLCANVNLPYLLELGVDILSFDAYQMEFMSEQYAQAVAEFVGRGGVICWGIVPTESVVLDRKTPEELAGTIGDYWGVVSRATGLSGKQLAEQALLAPARCCLRDVSQGLADDAPAGRKALQCGDLSLEERTVEKAFGLLPLISGLLRERYGV